MSDVLQYLLLFLVAQAPFSGYDIRQMFQASPVGRFSDSPGAIYPALARLEKRGWATSRAEKSGRRRRTYSATAAGRKALRQWLATPVAAADVERRPDVLALRYVMTAEFCAPVETVAFLEDCCRRLADHIAALKAYLAGRMVCQSHRWKPPSTVWLWPNCNCPGFGNWRRDTSASPHKGGPMKRVAFLMTICLAASAIPAAAGIVTQSPAGTVRYNLVEREINGGQEKSITYTLDLVTARTAA